MNGYPLYSGVSGGAYGTGAGTDHATLTNLVWPTCGHTGVGLAAFAVGGAAIDTQIQYTDAADYVALSTTLVNGDLVLAPNGTGALQAAVPTPGSSTGGNVRGSNAVDLQTARNSAGQVASGVSAVLTGGTNNIASGQYSVVNGGRANTASSSDSTVGGGVSNIASSTGAAVAGGGQNVATSTYAAVSGGQNNTASAAHAFVGGGQSNTAAATHSTIGGGNLNDIIALATYAHIGGGYDNNIGAGGLYATIGGGQANSTDRPHATIGGGYQNSVNSPTYGTVSGGHQNTANNNRATVAGGFGNISSGDSSFTVGFSNTASGTRASVPGGQSNLASAIVSSALGFQAVADHYGEHAHASGRFALNGDAQRGTLGARTATTDATPTPLSLDGAVDAADNRFTVAANQGYTFDIQVQASQTGGASGTRGDTKWWRISGTILNKLGVTALCGGLQTLSDGDAAAAAWVIAVTASDANDCLVITFTGEASKDIRVNATVRYTKLGY